MKEPKDIQRTVYIMQYKFKDINGNDFIRDVYGLCYDFNKAKKFLEDKYNVELENFVKCQARCEVRSLNFEKFIEMSKLESIEVMK